MQALTATLLVFLGTCGDVPAFWTDTPEQCAELLLIAQSDAACRDLTPRPKRNPIYEKDDA